jgi:hypothetical protein
MLRTTPILALALLIAAPALAAPAPQSALAQMPVREVTVFKDGHAFVLHSGRMPVDASGRVLMDYLPTPVIGTFWPYSAQRGVRLSAVTASPRRVVVERTALSVRELLEGNSGAEVTITTTDNQKFEATIIGVPQRSGEELERTSPPNTGPRLPEKGNIILLRTATGTLAMPIDQVKNVTFRGEPKPALGTEEFRNLLALKLEWPGGRPAPSADVGMMYLQKGLRWIPAYRVSLDGKGNAAVKLQATLLNELTDLSDVSANLVIGVPRFFFQDTPDPISLQQAFAQLSPYFQAGSPTGQAFSNALMTQTARMGDRAGGFGGGGLGGGGFPGGPAAPAAPGPEVGGAERAEDLFLFNVKNVTLAKGERMVLPVADYELKYRDVYTLDLPFAPPPEVRGNISNEQQAELARLLAAPRVMHKVRIANRGPHPFTTAPALLLSGEQVLAQGMTTYTAVGAEMDLAITTAGDIRVKKAEKESGRTPNAVQLQGNTYARVDMTGTITLTNHLKEAVEVEVTRYVLGNTNSAGQGGTATMVNAFEESGALSPDSNPYGGAWPHWWNWFNWPYGWHRVNGVGRFTWKVRLAPGQTQELTYSWHYFAP